MRSIAAISRPSPQMAAPAPDSSCATTSRAKEGVTTVRIEPNTVTAYVDLAGLGAGQYALTVRADVGRDAGVMRTAPSTVQVRIADAK